jgi:hypothetical protein
MLLRDQKIFLPQAPPLFVYLNCRAIKNFNRFSPTEKIFPTIKIDYDLVGTNLAVFGRSCTKNAQSLIILSEAR